MSSCEEIKDLIQRNDNIILVDVRTRTEYQQSHLPGSILIPLTDLPEHLSQLRDKTVFLYCRTGARSQIAASYLKDHGIPSVDLGGISKFVGCLQYQ